MTPTEAKIVAAYSWPEALPEKVEVSTEALRILLAASAGHPWPDVGNAAKRLRGEVFAHAARAAE